MTDITIPPEALEAGRKAFANAGAAEDGRDPFAEACLAMLKAWPGTCHAHNENGVNVEWATWYALPWHRANASEGIILPLTTENTNV